MSMIIMIEMVKTITEQNVSILEKICFSQQRGLFNRAMYYPWSNK